MSTHECKVIKIKLEPFPETEKLAKVIVNGEQIIVRRDQWQENQLAIYIEADYVCPDTEMFKFLSGHMRIKPRRFCGEWSNGLLIPAPEGAKEGEDWMEKLGIVRYDPEMHFSTRTDGISGPPGLISPKYDIENFRKYKNLFQEGEEVVVTEKIHGASSKFTCVNETMYIGSRNGWKKEDPKSTFWRAYEQNKSIEGWCRHNEGLILYGEVFGSSVQNMKYGALPGQIFFNCFDIMKNGNWLNYDEARTISPGIDWVPVLYRGPYIEEKIMSLRSGPSTILGSDNIREGIVIRPITERRCEKIGRVQFKLVSEEYLSK